MRLNEFSNKLPVAEASPFDSMVDQLGNAPKKGPGRWPDKTDTPGKNYSGDKANDRNSYGRGVGTSPGRKKDLDQLKGPGPSRIKKVTK